MSRYLNLLKSSLLNEIYLDDELRLLYLRDCLQGDIGFDYSIYHDVRNTLPKRYEALKESRQIGRFPDRSIHNSGFSHTMIGRARLDSLHGCLDQIRANGVPGDLIECGVWRGGACIFMAGWLKEHGLTDRYVYLADSFDGVPRSSHDADKELHLAKDRYPELAVSQETVEQNFALYDLLDGNIRFLKGQFKDTLSTASIDQIALLRLDGDLYESTMDSLVTLYDKVAAGGIVIVDDYGVLPPCRQAVHDYFEVHREPLPDFQQADWSGIYWVKEG